MELSRCAMAQIIPACLNDDHFTDDGSYWDPERWFMASFEKVRIDMEICASQFHHLHALLYILCDLIFMVLTHPHFFFRDFRSLPLTFFPFLACVFLSKFSFHISLYRIPISRTVDEIPEITSTPGVSMDREENAVVEEEGEE